MKLYFVALIAASLSAVVFGEHHPEWFFINQLNSEFGFDHNIFFFHSSVETNRFVSSMYHNMKYTTRSLFTMDDMMKLSVVEQNRTSKAELWIVAAGSLDIKSVVETLSLIKKIQVWKANSKIGIFFSLIWSNHDLYELFTWCWNHRILNIFAAFRAPTSTASGSQTLNIFNYVPFGTFKVVNVTGTKSLRRIFHEKISNFQGHSFRLAVIADDDLVQYSSTVAFSNGPDEMLWQAVFSVINASYSIFLVKGSLEPIDVMDNGTVDIHGDLTDILNQQIVTIYPMVLEIVSMVLPEPRPYGTFQAYIQIATSTGFMGYSLGTVLAVVLVLMCSRRINSRNILLYQCFIDVMNLLLYDNTAIKYQRMSFSEIMLILPITFAGFIIVNGFLSSLKSQLTQPMMQPRIETIDEFYNSPIPMTTPNEYWLAKDAEMLNNLLNHEGNFTPKMRVIEYSKFVEQIIAEEMFSFAEYNSIAKFMCKHKKYYITKIQMQRIWYSHNLRSDCPFIDRFNEIIYRITQAGLYEKWWRDASVEDRVFRNASGEELHGEQFSAPIFIVYGWIVGIFVFVVEVNWERIKNKWKRR